MAADEEEDGPVRVVLCDDAVGFPELVAVWLRQPGLDLVARVDTHAGLDAIIEDSAPDVLLLDLMLPDGVSTAEMVTAYRGLVPGLRVVLVSSTPGFLLEEEARKLGVDAYCHKATTADKLRAVVLGAPSG